MEGIFPQGVVCVTFNCTERGRESSFNQWYDKVHLPELLKLDGITTAHRFVRREVPLGPEPEQPQYLTVIELDTEDAGVTKEALIERCGELQKRDEIHAALDIVRVDGWTKISKNWTSERTDEPSTGIAMVFSNPQTPRAADDLNRWYDEMHMDDMLATGFFHTGYRYRNVEAGNRYAVRSEFMAIYETEQDPVNAMTGVFIGGPRWRVEGRTTAALAGNARPHWVYSRLL